MYRHLLVPIDDTDLSIEVVGNAVGLARAVGARITFFHAVAGSAGLPAGIDPLRRMRQDDAAPAGKAGELFAKAEAAARAFGVPCDSRHVASDELAAAIVEAARISGADLVFMASQGKRRDEAGIAPASRTLSAVMNAGLPVMVSGVADPGPPAHAIGIIRDEHRSLAAVLHAGTNALAAARGSGVAADPGLMRAIVRYIEVFALALHDLKEEDHLFKRLRERTGAVNAELDELERQHRRERECVADLARRVDALAAASGEPALDATRDLDAALRSYATFLWEQLGREEGVILPAAQRHLTDADWSEIETEFMKNRDPGGEGGGEASHLYSRIVNANRAWQ